jgi:hypothetical protein
MAKKMFSAIIFAFHISNSLQAAEKRGKKAQMQTKYLSPLQRWRYFFLFITSEWSEHVDVNSFTICGCQHKFSSA